jgi:iron complex outermembrane recepter protein
VVVHQKPTSDRLLRSIPLTAAIIGPLMSAAPLLAAPQLEEITVTATLQAEDGRRSAVTVFGRPFIDDRSAQHIEDLLSAAPNVNVASGASRGRFFQIRGIGERSQFVEPVNAST